MIRSAIGRKLGMTRIFLEDGTSVPVTVLDLSGNVVVSFKTVERDGYSAVQIGCGDVKRRRRREFGLSRPLAFFYKKLGLAPKKILKEFPLPQGQEGLEVGSPIDVSIFSVGSKVDVSGTTIGKGFAGVIKRHGFSSGPATHGCSLSHRTPGSTGMNQDPGRVFPGKKMPGHMGDVKRTVLSLEVVRVDTERNLLFVKGAVPGCKGGAIYVRQAVKVGVK